MTISEEKISEIEKILQDLFSHIVLGGKVSERAPLGGYLSVKEPFAIDYAGYYGPYHDLMRSIFSIEKLGEQWSDEAIKGKIFERLVLLAENKRDTVLPSFHEIAADFMKEIDVEFQKQECYVPVTGLVVEKPLQIGDVTFLPLS